MIEVEIRDAFIAEREENRPDVSRLSLLEENLGEGAMVLVGPNDSSSIPKYLKEKWPPKPT